MGSPPERLHRISPSGRFNTRTGWRASYACAVNEPDRAEAAAPFAWSMDGRLFRFISPIAHIMPVGGFTRLTVEGGPTYLGQVVYLEAPTTPPQLVHGEGTLLCKLQNAKPVAPTLRDVFGRAGMSNADEELVASYLESQGRGSSSLDVGRLLEPPLARARLIASGFNRHTFLVGQTGSGKTFAMGVVLERLLLETDLRIVVIDPNGDFGGLGKLRTRTQFDETRGSPLDEAEYGGIASRYRKAVEGLRVFGIKAGPGRERLRIRFGDLTPIGQIAALRLDPINDREEFNAGYWIARGLKQPYSLQEVLDAVEAGGTMGKAIRMRMENLGLLLWSIWAEAHQPSLADYLSQEWRAMVVDVSQLGRPDERPALVLAVLEHFWNQREERRPVLIAIDEAHAVCPPESRNALVTRMTEHMVRIAGEGRKFGLFLLLATQRPDKIHANVISMCDNLILMRVNSAADVSYLGHRFSSVRRSLIDLASGFKKGDGLITGDISPTPTIAHFEGRLSVEGGGDVPTTWARANASTTGPA
jgi:uncharacterized protein DUF87/ATPase family protein associated with various cellular activities (AAA)